MIEWQIVPSGQALLKTNFSVDHFHASCPLFRWFWDEEYLLNWKSLCKMLCVMLWKWLQQMKEDEDDFA